MTNNTRDLSEFGFRELGMAAALLTAYATEHKGPDDFNAEGVAVEFNPNSGNVFLVNEEYQVAMMNGDTLESFYTCPYCGSEGFKDDIHNGDKADELNAECLNYLRDIGIDDERTETDPGEDEPEETDFVA